MSLLEKAQNEREPLPESQAERSSLFARALASSAREPGPEAPPARSGSVAEAEGRIALLKPSDDAVIALWELCSSHLPLAALALFLPRGDFLALAAKSGFPAGRSEPLPQSTAPSKEREGYPLPSDAKALIAPLLGVGAGMELRATSLRSDSGALVGLWVYHAPALEGRGAEIAEVSKLLASGARLLQGFALERTEEDCLPRLLEASRRFPSAIILRFELSRLFESGICLHGIEREALRSAFLAACRKLLGESGFALAWGDSAVACLLGSSSDPELALFQFSKTLRRLLPFIAVSGFPPAVAEGLAPASPAAAEELERFLSA